MATTEPPVTSSDQADLVDQWIVRDSRTSSEGDAAKIDALLSTELIELAATDDGWRRLYRHRTTGSLWELSYPHSDMHGGGPRRLRQLPHSAPEEWR